MPATVVVLLVCLAVCGCTRKYWRNQADDLTYDILQSKQFEPLWTVPRVDLQPDPRSRFFDPYDPDKPPLPPDDPSAHQYMHALYGMKGYKGWHKFGDTFTVENPCWLEQFGLSQEVVEANYGKPAVLPEVKELRLEEAIGLAYIHSRDFQLQLENMYLVALNLTFQRFVFDVQFFGLGNRRPSSDFTWEDVPTTKDTLTWNNRIGVNKLLPAGGQMAAEFANSTLWLFSGGPGKESTASVLSYSVVQPLLAGGGKRFVLEGLTQSERDVLYAIRNFARFRMQFFTGIVSTQGGGYLSLLSQIQQIANARYNIQQQVEQLDRLRAEAAQRPEEISAQLAALPAPLAALPAGMEFPENLRQKFRYDREKKLLYLRESLSETEVQALLALSNDPVYQTAVRELAQQASLVAVTLQIAQQQNTLLTTYLGLFNSEIALQNSLDSYKVQLGLPTDMVISVDETLLKPFQLIDARVIKLQDDLKDFVAEWANLDQDDPDQNELQRIAAKLAALRERVRAEGLLVLEDDLARAMQVMPRRLAEQQTEDDRQRIAYNAQRDQRLIEDLKVGFAVFSKEFSELQSSLEKPALPQKERGKLFSTMMRLREDLLTVAQGLSAVEIGLRTELITLNPFDMTMEQAVALGLENRMDLKNARGAVMDARRKMEVAANQLQAVLNIVAAGDIRTKSTASGNPDPFEFHADQNSIRAGVSFTAPVQLVQQRNTYRAALIAYQQSRRAYMLLEDTVKQQVRSDWRQLMLARRNLEINKQAVRVNALQLDSAIEATLAPTGAAGAQQAAAGGQAGANQGLALTQAFSSVLNAQNQLITTWTNYESFRLNIHRDMGIMEVDPQGFWTDEYYQELERNLAGSSLLLGPAPVTDLVAPDVAPEEPAVIVPPPAGAQLQEPLHAPRLFPPVSRRISPASSSQPSPLQSRRESRPPQPGTSRLRGEASGEHVIHAGHRDRCGGGTGVRPGVVAAAGEIDPDHGSGQEGRAGHQRH